MFVDYRNITPVTPFFLTLFLAESRAAPATQLDRTDGVVVRTVPAGSTVILKCTSNDPAHNFQFWHLVEKGPIIGPANNYDPAKFKFEILTGNLTIRAVSKQEEGLYECVSRAVKGEAMNIRVIKMNVESDWEDIYEHDYHINLIRVLIALITLVLISMGAYFVYRIWKDRYRYPRYLEPFEDDDDDSAEEIFSQPSTSKAPSVNSHIVPGKSKKQKESAFADVDISTDFKSILDTANDE